MNSGHNFQKPCYQHCEFRISLHSKDTSQSPLKRVGLLFSLSLCPVVTVTIREVVVCCSALSWYTACDSPELLQVFTGTLWLVTYLPHVTPCFPSSRLVGKFCCGLLALPN